MSEKTFNLSDLDAILEKARAENQRLHKNLESLKDKVAFSDTRVKTLEDTIGQLAGGLGGKSQKDMILQIIQNHGGVALTARDIASVLELKGFTFASNNPTASVHMACDQLAAEGKIEILKTDSGKLFKLMNPTNPDDI